MSKLLHRHRDGVGREAICDGRAQIRPIAIQCRELECRVLDGCAWSLPLPRHWSPPEDTINRKESSAMKVRKNPELCRTGVHAGRSPIAVVDERHVPAPADDDVSEHAHAGLLAPVADHANSRRSVAETDPRKVAPARRCPGRVPYRRYPDRVRGLTASRDTNSRRRKRHLPGSSPTLAGHNPRSQRRCRHHTWSRRTAHRRACSTSGSSSPR